MVAILTQLRLNGLTHGAANAKAWLLGIFKPQTWRLMVGVALFIWCWMLVYGLFFYQPAYTTESMVLIKDSAITADYVTAEVGYTTTSSNAANPVLNTMELLYSATVSDAMWTFFKTKHPEALRRLKIKNRKAWGTYYKDGSDFISAKNKPGTDLILIKFTWSDPKLAKRSKHCPAGRVSDR